MLINIKSLVFLVAACAFNQYDASGQEELDSIKEELFVSTLANKALHFPYLLDKIAIVDEQKTEIESAAADFRTQFANLFANGTAGPTGFRRLQKGFVAEIESILLPHQLAIVKDVFYQRFLQQRTGKNLFELVPEFSKQLSLTSGEKKKLVSEVEEARNELESETKKLRGKAWEAISNALPESIDGPVQEYLERSPSAPRLKFADDKMVDIANWEDNDFSRLEERQFYQLVYSLHGDSTLIQRLEISEEQQNEIRQMAIATADEEERISKQVAADNLKRIQLAGQGKHEEANQLAEKNAAIEHKFLHDNARDIASTVLMPHQQKWIENMAHWKRHMLESKFGDEFGLPVALAKAGELLPDEQSEIKKVVEKERSEYYKKVSELREKLNKQILNELSSKKKKEFQAIVGEPYDLQAEIVSFWDNARKK